MALLGVHLVVSMIMATVMSKLMPRFSFAKYILCSRLARYVQPNQEELCAAAHVPKPTRKTRGRRDSGGNDEVTIPKSTAISLDLAKVRYIDVLQLHFYSDFQWLIDFSVCSIVVYIISEVYVGLLKPRNEFNLSLLWCVVAMLFALRILYSVTAIYFRTEGGERQICVIFAFAFLVLSMGIIITDEQTMDFGLHEAYSNFSVGAIKCLESQGFESAGPMSFLTFQILLVISSAIIGSFFAFPGMRLAKMHTDAIKYGRENRPLQILLYINMLFPLVLSLMWIRPITKSFLRSNGAFKLSVGAFNMIRILSLLAFCCVRFLLIWTHLQAHLNMADQKIQQLRKEAGRISVKEIQLMVSHIFQYLCVVALQYIAPVVLLCHCTLLLKTLSYYSWFDLFHPFSPLIDSAVVNATEKITVGDSVVSQTTSTSLVTALSMVFTPVFFNGVLSYFCWWICAASFTTSVFGMIYYNYFSN